MIRSIRIPGAIAQGYVTGISGGIATLHTGDKGPLVNQFPGPLPGLSGNKAGMDSPYTGSMPATGNNFKTLGRIFDDDPADFSGGMK